MTRRLTEHKKVNFEGDELSVMICFEEGVNKEQIKKELPYSITHQVLVRNGSRFDFIRENSVN